ncbi:MAG: ion channel [Kordiimonas sp.]
MIRFKSLFSRIYLKCVELDWSVLVLVALAHYVTSYVGFVAAGESSLIQDGVFPYYYFTTVSTVGYGDLSPSTEMGRTFFVAYVLPGGLTVFTIVLGKAIGSFSDYFRKKANGMGDFSKVDGATVIVGYHPQRTSKMIDEIAAGDSDALSNIILISTKDVAVKAGLRYVKAESLSNAADLKRAAVEKAERVVVYADNDDLSLTAVLAVRSLNRDAHLVCYFTDAEKAALLGDHCDAEVIVSASVEMVARELTDPGSSELISDLVSAQGGVATFSLEIPASAGSIERQAITSELAEHFGATLISVRGKDNGGHHYDPRSSAKLEAGDAVFYISESRVDASLVNWERCA